jgi:hypothetical protein
MPAPQASMMKQLARLKFSQGSNKMPDKWSQPSGDPGADHYGKAFKDNEKSTPPDTTMPPLFQTASANKYHTDTQKKINDVIGKYLDGICTAICSAWSQWQSMATLVGVVVNAVTAVGGQVVGPPLTPLILASGPKSTPQEMKYTNTIATVIGTSWLAYTAGIKVKGMPWYPAFAAFPSPVAPPTPNIPCPLIAISSAASAVGASAMKGQMISQFGDPQAQWHKEIFDAVTDAFEKCHKIWEPSTMVTNVLGTGPIPTYAPPYVPVGPVVGGVGTMPPGGFV